MPLYSESTEYYKSNPSASYVDGCAGGGKTTALLHHAGKMRSIIRPSTELKSGRLGIDFHQAAQYAVPTSTDTLVAAFPSRGMTNQQERNLLGYGLPAEDTVKITSDTENHVVASLMRTLLQSGGIGKNILCTHQALFRLPFLPRAGLQLVVDELPPFVAEDTLHLSCCGELLDKWLTIEPIAGTIYSRVVPKNEGKLKRFLEEVPDTLFARSGARGICYAVLSPFTQVYTLIEHYEWTVVRGERGELPIYFMLNPASVDDMTFMSANFHGSPLHNYLTRNGTRLRPHAELMAGRMHTEHEHRDVNIYWAADRDRNSRQLLKMPGFQEKYEAAGLKVANERTFLFYGNVNYRGPLRASKQHILVPCKPHGLNDPIYQDQTVFISIGAFNLDPMQGNFLRNQQGFSAETLDRQYYDDTYQAAWRSNLRVWGSDKPVDIVVPDRGVAEYLAKKQPGARLIRMGGFGEFDKKVPMSSAERKRKQRAKQQGHYQ